MVRGKPRMVIYIREQFYNVLSTLPLFADERIEMHTRTHAHVCTHARTHARTPDGADCVRIRPSNPAALLTEATPSVDIYDLVTELCSDGEQVNNPFI